MARCYRTCCTAKRRGCGAIQRIAGKARCCGNRLRALGFTPRRYRHRYFDGWQEKDIRAAMLFGRAFEEALAALLRHEDPAVVLFDEWAVCKNMGLTYSGYDTWDRNVPARHPVARALCPGRTCPRSPAAIKPADSAHPNSEFRQQLLSPSAFQPWIHNWSATPG
jgi:hypothetical protein